MYIDLHTKGPNMRLTKKYINGWLNDLFAIEVLFSAVSVLKLNFIAWLIREQKVSTWKT